MKQPVRPPTIAALALACALLAGAPVAAQPLELATLDGGAWSTAQLDSGAFVLVFWAGWSPKCRDIAAQAEAIEARVSGSARVVMVNFQEPAAAARDFLGGSIRLPQVLDEQGWLAKRYSIVSLPGLLVVRDGRVLYQGRLPAEGPAEVRRLLDS